MSKTLYEEALADARKLKEVAENNAKRAVEEAVLPKIRDLIERKLFEDLDSEEEDMWGLDNDDDDLLATSDIEPQNDNKVVLDLDKLAACCEPCEPSVEEEPFLDDVNSVCDTYVEPGMDKLSESMDKIKKDVVMYKTSSKVIRESKEFSNKIEELIERIQDTYSYVQECVNDSLKRKNIENILEGYYTEMSNFKEKIVMKNVKNLVNEGDLTIKLTGVPDDLDVDDLGIDLITGDDDMDDDMGDEEEMDSSDSESDELPSDDSSESDDEEEMDTNDELPVEESSDSNEDDMKDDDVVEISETMLKREIARMRNQRTIKENSMPVDNFGSGEADGDPWLDAELNASDEAVNEGDEEVSSEEEAPSSSDEETSLKNKLNKETCTYTESLSRYFYLISEANKNKDKKKKTMLLDKAKKEAAKANEAKKKAADTKKNLKKLHLENHENRGSVSVTESRNQIESLRNKLNESNLFNAKLLATNKLLQNESLSSKQKISAIERLDEAKNVREVKLVYESIAKSIATKNSVNEHRVIGSSSRATKTSTSLNESVEEGESSRWARLAGIK